MFFLGADIKFPKFNLQKFEKSEGTKRKEFSNQLDKICRETGFLVLEGHGVPSAVIDAQWQVVSEFFYYQKKNKRFLFHTRDIPMDG